MKEATARIKINKLLEAAGWRFFPEGGAAANIRLEPAVAITAADLTAFGDDFERTKKGFVDFLLLDERGFPFIVLEAKAEDKNPLAAKEQARKYARSQNCRFVILSNGNLHYFWDLERGDPYVVTSFPSPGSVIGYQKVTPDPARLIAERVADDYIVLTQRPTYQSEAGYAAIARRAGVSQPYLFQLFGTKQELFLAAVRDCFARTAASFEESAARAGADGRDPVGILTVMGDAYVQLLLADRELLRLQLHAYSACGEPEVRTVVRDEFNVLWQTVARVSGAAPEALPQWFANGMLITVIASFGNPRTIEEFYALIPGGSARPS